MLGYRMLLSSPPDYHSRWLTLENCDCCPDHSWWRPDGSAHVCTLCWSEHISDEDYASAVLFSGLPVC